MVAKPEVYKSANSDCYIVFGDVRYFSIDVLIMLNTDPACANGRPSWKIPTLLDSERKLSQLLRPLKLVKKQSKRDKQRAPEAAQRELSTRSRVSQENLPAQRRTTSLKPTMQTSIPPAWTRKISRLSCARAIARKQRLLRH